MTNYHFFYGGYCSQWYKSDFTIDGVSYSSAEQYMMAEKARMFGDDDALQIIMSTRDPRIQKATGRVVENFNKEIWEASCREIVYRANYAKFTQNEELKKWLLAQGDVCFVEASPWDKIWGIGMAFDHPDINDPEKWKGTNWLGEAINRVRDELLGR